MTTQNTRDWQAAHSHFATSCFNKVWEYIEKKNRSMEDDLAMLHNTITSLWHWTQREDCTPTNLSIGYWQVAYVFSLLGEPDLARRYAALCRDVSAKLDPFYLGEAYQALASAEKTAGNRIKMEVYLKKAQRIVEKLTDEEEKEALTRDLNALSMVKIKKKSLNR